MSDDLVLVDHPCSVGRACLAHGASGDPLSGSQSQRPARRTSRWWRTSTQTAWAEATTLAVLVEEGAGGAVGAGAGPDGPADRDQRLADRDVAGAVGGERAEQRDPAGREHRGGVADAVQRAPHGRREGDSVRGEVGGRVVRRGEDAGLVGDRSGRDVEAVGPPRDRRRRSPESACRRPVNGWASRASSAWANEGRTGGSTTKGVARRTVATGRSPSSTDSPSGVVEHGERPPERHLPVQGHAAVPPTRSANVPAAKPPLACRRGPFIRGSRAGAEVGMGRGGGPVVAWCGSWVSKRVVVMSTSAPVDPGSSHRRNRPTALAGIGHRQARAETRAMASATVPMISARSPSSPETTRTAARCRAGRSGRSRRGCRRPGRPRCPASPDHDRLRVEAVAEVGQRPAGRPAGVGEHPAYAGVPGLVELADPLGRQLLVVRRLQQADQRGAATRVSRQPRLPQRQTWPSSPTWTWPISPAIPEVPRCSRPPRTILRDYRALAC